MTPKNIHKIFTPQKIFIFLKTPKNIEIQNTYCIFYFSENAKVRKTVRRKILTFNIF